MLIPFVGSLGAYPAPSTIYVRSDEVARSQTIAKCMPHVHAMHSQKACLFLFLWVCLLRSFSGRVDSLSNFGIKMIQEVWNHHLDVLRKIEAKAMFSAIYLSHPKKNPGKHVCHFDATVIATIPRGTVDKLPTQPKFKGYQKYPPRLCYQPLPGIRIHKVLSPNDLGETW